MSGYNDAYAGVAQGSIVGPILLNKMGPKTDLVFYIGWYFILVFYFVFFFFFALVFYTANLKVQKPGKLALFTDDTAMNVQATRMQLLTYNINKKTVPALEHWYDKQRMKINVHKT